jgi:hypothetical protein
MRRHSDVLCIRSAIRKTKHLITLFEPFFSAAFFTQLRDRTRELNAKNLGSPRRYRILSFTLIEVHAI